jgi:hypothetical protein
MSLFYFCEKQLSIRSVFHQSCAGVSLLAVAADEDRNLSIAPQRLALYLLSINVAVAALMSVLLIVVLVAARSERP